MPAAALPRLGWLPDPPKPPGAKPDREAGPVLRAAPSPPAEASNDNGILGILDQGPLGSCVVNSIAQNIRASHFLQGIVNPRLASRLLWYYLSRVLHGDEREDTGTYLRSAFEAANRWGFCSEELWPYVPERFAERPPWAAFRGAHDQAEPPPTEYRRIVAAGAARIDEIKRAIAAGFLVSFGTQVSVPFCEGQLGSGPIDPPIGLSIAGGHALLVSSYRGDRFRIVNSWGTDWGEDGWCTFSADYLAHPMSTDFWIVTKAPRYSE